MSTIKWCLLGFPDDEGVKNVGGRIGAAKGPRFFKEFFQKINGQYDVKQDMMDLEEVVWRIDKLDEKHESAIEAVEENQSLYDFSIIVGGGHDYSYCHLKGVKNSYNDKVIGCINIDPHFDMRKPEPDMTSGAPFYMAINEGVIKGENLVSFGIQPHSNGPDLWKFAKKNKVKTVLFEDLRNGKSINAFRESLKKLVTSCDIIVISLDMDAFSAPFAPGVSAPAIEGFTPSEVMDFIKIAAKEEKVKSLGIFELNPNYDIDNRTAKLAAGIAYYFAAEKISG